METTKKDIINGIRYLLDLMCVAKHSCVGIIAKINQDLVVSAVSRSTITLCDNEHIYTEPLTSGKVTKDMLQKTLYAIIEHYK
jgi:hypothetical protein